MKPGESGTSETPTFWAAADLAKLGYPVFPLNGKEPSVEGGFYAATTDPSQVAEWIDEGREDHGVGFATGLVSGVVVMDADTPEAAAAMEADYGPPHVRTKRGGHWYFSHPRNGKVTSSNVRDALDRKGDGGYAAAPPSRGRAWTDGIPDRNSLPELPREFWSKGSREKSEAPRSPPEERKDAAAEAIAARVSLVPQGKRHEHLKHLCGVLLARGVATGDAEDVLIAAWTKAGGDLLERAEREVPNTLATTEQALAEGRATGVPSLEEITPGLYAELGDIFGWKVRATAGGRERSDEARLPWPELDPAALQGLPGRIVRTIEPCSEADPVAVLANLLVWFGNAIGRGAVFRVGEDAHHANLFAALVGESSKSRKGMSRGHVRGLMHVVDSAWAEERVQNGLSSGEGLMYAIRDEVRGVNKDGDPVAGFPRFKSRANFVSADNGFVTLSMYVISQGTLISLVHFRVNEEAYSGTLSVACGQQLVGGHHLKCQRRMA